MVLLLIAKFPESLTMAGDWDTVAASNVKNARPAWDREREGCRFRYSIWSTRSDTYHSAIKSYSRTVTPLQAQSTPWRNQSLLRLLNHFCVALVAYGACGMRVAEFAAQ
jgi:hypothetical protein